MDLIPNDWKHLKLKLLKRKINLRHYIPITALEKSKNSLIKKFTSPFVLIVLNNTKNLSNLLHDQTSLKDTSSQSRKL